MTATAVELVDFLVEEPSMEAYLRELLPRLIPGVPFDVHNLTNKDSLLKKLPSRLAGYSTWTGVNFRVVILVDRDDDDCVVLRQRLVGAVESSGLTLDSARSRGQVLVRVVVEELEAWHFGDVQALASVFPGVPNSLGERAGFRDPDGIKGGTWEALERVLQKAGHHDGGLRKMECAQQLASRVNIESNRSTSFIAFRDGLRRLIGME